MIDDKKFLFLSGFSEEEWVLNGHEKKDVEFLLNIFESLLPYIKKGKYLELGCGTGILCRFLHLFSKKSIVPYGIDRNMEAIHLARKNNFEFSNNFVVSDYFKLNASVFSEFSTVTVFMSTEKGVWDRLKKLISSILEINTNINNIIIFSYDYDLLNIENSQIRQFVSNLKIKRLTKLTQVNKNFFILKRYGKSRY